MDFPKFDGTDAHVWLDKCCSYFALYQIPDSFRVAMASIHMEDRAAHWFQSYKYTPRFHEWGKFIEAVLGEFDVDIHRSSTMDFLYLRQTCSVEAYHVQFEQLVYRIRLYDSSINETMLVSKFIIGLREEICNIVEMQLPDSVQRAAVLAQVQEQMLQRRRSGYKPSVTRNTPSQATPG